MYQRGFCHLKMASGMVAPKGIVLSRSILLHGHTYFHYRQKIESDGTDLLSIRSITQLPNQAVVWFLVHIEICTHNSASISVVSTRPYNISSESAILMVAHQNYSILIYAASAGNYLIDIICCDCLPIGKGCGASSCRQESLAVIRC